ncbi:neuromusculin isoform X1 [Rhynchophorus ferrugineus]|uniref:neuromusculin isoform X1 n=1 Tax=Rhynchophorus ferrugineus TaxID=354439 RepID=UPI003FCD64B7
MASYGDMFAVFIAILAINVGFTAGAGTKTKDMFAHVGTNARLPCPVNPGLCGKLHSVKWYKDTSRIYVLSHAGTIRRPEGDAKERMKVEYPTEAGQAILQIDDVHLEDEAIYKCEITYIEVKESCHEVVQIVNLTTLVKPEVVRIIGMDGAPMENGSILGPKEEGEEVDLVCEAGSGKPIPRVSWYNGTTLISRAQYTTNDLGDGVGMGSSKLQLTLTRGDLNAQFTCKVESEALDGPIMHWIKFDVHVRPTKMELSGVKNHVVQGTNVLLICDVHGARPPAKVRWTNGSVPITDETLVQTSPEDNFGITSDVRINDRDGTYTTKSQLIFQASHWENGIKIHCYAENDVTKHHYEPEMHKLIILEVRYPPVISIHPKNITVNESTELVPTNGTLLSCKYKANPQELKGALWSKDGKNLTLTDTVKYKGGTIENPPLIIYNVTREDMGDYTCWLKNEVGSEQSSDSIFLNVQYTPDVEVLMEPPTPIKALDRTNVILECNVTSGNPATLSKVRWFLDGELMKEFPECNYTSKDDSGGPFCGLDPSILSLERVDQTFAGNYTCQGENVAGWGPISEPVELIVYYPPSPAKIRYYPSKVVKGAEVNLECKVESTGRPDNVTYIWYRGSHQMTEITTSKHKIVPVGLETRSNFTCIAMNEGGQSEPATVFINVNAPPALFDRLKPYQGILYSAQQINLTCRVECFPLCNIIWKKNGRILEFNERNTLYYNKTVIHPPDLQKNIFESIESTLIWNMTARPGQKLNRTDPNSNYTCQSESNQIGPGVSSTIEIAVDYPPEDVYVSSKLINVIEGQAPNPVKCHGKGHPNLTYKWKKNATAEPKEYSEELRLGPMMRSDSGSYICEASNKHGKQNAIVYFNVQYAPECSITRTEKDGSPALLCTVQANPQEVTFFWKAMEGNETYMETNNVIQDGLKSFLILDSTVDTKRTYQCFANNSVGFSDKQPCKMEVEGILPWWKRLNQEKRIIIIAAIIAIIICILIICIVIICVCRRKRANTKYNNPLEMEEREKPDGHSPIDQSKWPLKPGVLVHVSKLNNVSISQLNSSTLDHFKKTSVTTSAYLKYRRRRSKVYDRLRRFKESLGLGGNRVPLGLKAGANGVVTFKKIESSPLSSRVDKVNPRKRKKPGDVPPNQSSIVGDKIRPGVVPPVGNMQDHPHSNNADPNDKGLYENLPFHGIQNPPNKNAFYTLTAPHCKQTILPPQYSATIPHQKHAKLIPKALFQEQLAKSKSFSSKSKHKRHFQIPLQKCHSFKFQTAESYFQPIKNIHEENLMRNGYVGEYPVSGSSTGSLHVTRNHKREKPKQKTKGPLVLRHANDHFQENIQNSVQLQYPQPILPGRGAMLPHPKQNGVVQYADLDMPSSRKGSHESSSSSSSKGHNMKQKQKTEYATLKFNDIGQEIDV